MSGPTRRPTPSRTADSTAVDKLRFFQVDRPAHRLDHGGQPTDVVRNFVFLANLAAQEVSGETGTSVSVARAVQRLAGSTESDSLMLVLAEPLGQLPDLPRSELGYPLLSSTTEAGADGEQPELEFHGFVHLSIPQHEDLDAVELEIVLDAAHQPVPGQSPGDTARQVYQLLLAEVSPVARQLGRHVLQLWETHRPEAEFPFLAQLRTAGFRPGLAEIQGVIEVAAAAETGPELPDDVSVAVLHDPNPVPALLPGLLELLHLASVDVPHGELRSEPQEWSPQRLAEAEARRLDTGLEVVSVLLVDAAGPVALCELHRHPASEPGTAEQGVTIVHPRRRGTGLGRAVKIQALRETAGRWPSVERVFTSNALGNTGMLAVNRGLGMRPVSHATAWQRILPTV